MAFSPLITISQNAGSPSTFVATDASTGSDGAINARRVYLYLPDNSTLVPSGVTTPYTNWPTVDGPLSLDVLARDHAIMLVAQWLNGSTVLYTYTNYYAFTAYTNTFMYSLSVDQSTNPTIISATDYFANKAKMYTFLKDAANSVSFNDINKAELALSLAYSYIINQNLYF